MDYVLINKSWKTSVINSKTLPGADWDTDHNLVVTKFRFKFMKITKPKQPPKLDVQKL